VVAGAHRRGLIPARQRGRHRLARHPLTIGAQVGADAWGIVNAVRSRTESPWHDLPRSKFGPWQTVWKRHRRYLGDGTCDRVLMSLLAGADAEGRLDWTVSVDATISRAHQRDQHDAARTRHRGLGRITRIFRWPHVNLQDIALAVPVVG
jgi:hypothetical protein